MSLSRKVLIGDAVKSSSIAGPDDLILVTDATRFVGAKVVADVFERRLRNIRLFCLNLTLIIRRLQPCVSLELTFRPHDYLRFASSIGG